MHFVHTFCSLTAKVSTVSPIFNFIILIRTVLPFSFGLCLVLAKGFYITVFVSTVMSKRVL